MKHLLRLFPNTEWSGVAFYKMVEPDEFNWSKTWRIEAFYPIDLGSSAATEFDGEQLMEAQDKAYSDNRKLRECYKGLIHSHHGLSGGAYISSVDKTQLEHCANDTGYPSLVVAHDETESPYAFSVSYKTQRGHTIITDYKKAEWEIDWGNYNPTGTFKECVESLEKQEKESKAVVKTSNIVKYNNPYTRQVSMWGNYNPKDVYDDDIKDKKYQELLEDFRKKEEHYMSLHWNHPKSDEANQKATEAEKKLDQYCFQIGLFGGAR